MEIDINIGDLVFLTKDYENYWKKKNPQSKIRLVNRIAKLEILIDWDTETGQRIKKARLESGKWNGLPLEDSRYIFSIYYHDVKGRKGQQGTIDRVPMFSKDPETGKDFFVKVPDWIFREISKECEKFNVEWKGKNGVS